jgi:1,4-dihydroxy-2-naphthoate octaprenyltransferase
MQTAVAANPVKVWVLASRPRTLPAAVAPVVVGMALAIAHGGFAWWPALAAMLGACFIQIGTNFANDYFDFKSGADTAERMGPLRVTQAGLVTPAQIKAATAIAFALATLCGLYLTWVGGWPIVVIGLLSILSGIAYTGGPFPLGYNGLGDLFVFVFFGLVAVGGTYYVQALGFSPIVLAVAVPVGLLSTAIIVVNNLRDVDTDVVAGKRTLAVMFGKRFAKAEYVALLALSYLAPVILIAMGKLSLWALLPLLSLPLAVSLVRKVHTVQGPALNPVLGGTGKLLLVFSLLFSLGLVL